MDTPILVVALSTLLIFPAGATPVTILSAGVPNEKMATASRPQSAGKFETESADDFIFGSPTLITGASFTALLESADIADIAEVRVEILRVFPNDWDVGRLSGPPILSTAQVPTRVNAPSDVDLADRETATFPLLGEGPPEPASLALLGVALLAIVVVKGRRRI